MCIIQGEVESVSGTKILVAKLANGKQQLTVYANQIAMAGDAPIERDIMSSHDARDHAGIMSFFADGPDASAVGRRGRSESVHVGGGDSCTFPRTQRNHTPQSFYRCFTCNQSEHQGVCEACATRCHRAHQLSAVKFGRFFCDCGADNPSCMALSARTAAVAWQPPGTGAQPVATATASSNNAMILPMPNGHTCVPVDLSLYDDVFDDLKALFPKRKSRSYTNAQTFSLSDGDLAVTQVGSFKVSVVPTLGDFERLRFDVFRLDPNVRHLLRATYPQGYGFLVCQLDHGAAFHPIAYVHQLMRNGDLFVPTVHFHGDAQHPVDWDHAIYVWTRNSGAVQSHVSLHAQKGTLPFINAVQTHGYKDSEGGVQYNTKASNQVQKIQQRLNTALHPCGASVQPYPFVYRIKIGSSYPYNHDCLVK